MLQVHSPTWCWLVPTWALPNAWGQLGQGVPAGGYGHEQGQATGPRPWPGVFNDLDVTRWSSPKKTLEPWQKMAVGGGGRKKPSSSMMSPAEPFGVGKAEQLPRGGAALCSISHPSSGHEATGLAAGWQRNHFHGFQLFFLVHTTHNGTWKRRVLFQGLLVFEKKPVRWDLFLEVFAMGNLPLSTSAPASRSHRATSKCGASGLQSATSGCVSKVAWTRLARCLLLSRDGVVLRSENKVMASSGFLVLQP